MKKTQQPNIAKKSCKEYTDDFKGGSRKRLSEREIFELKAGRLKKKNLMLNNMLSDKGVNKSGRKDKFSLV